MSLAQGTPHTTRRTGTGAPPGAPTVTAGRVLLVVDGEGSGAAIRSWITGSSGNLGARDAVLLAVLPQPETIRSRGIFMETVRRSLLEAGEARLAPLRAALDDRGIPHDDRIEIADEIEAIRKIAEEQACDLVVVAAAPASEARQRWARVTGIGMRSLAARVSELAACPVLVLKHEWH